MKIYRANFGENNKYWPQCVRNGEIIYYSEIECWRAYLAEDESAARSALSATVSARVNRKPKSDAALKRLVSTYYNQLKTFAETSGDIWLHHDTKDLWWCKSIGGVKELGVFEPQHRDGDRFQAMLLSHDTENGWSRLQSQLYAQQISDARNVLVRQPAVETINPPLDDVILKAIAESGEARNERKDGWDASIDRALRNAVLADKQSGQLVTSTRKMKLFGYESEQEMRSELRQMLDDQREICPITGHSMQREDHPVKELVASLDRIDSAKGYQRGNLQWVCRFVNFLKGAKSGADFDRLTTLLMSGSRYRR
ncbi:hypothetical protein sos41_27270 [Alphaproteobacteria bacterium SO-S41]|nr:hypothetical protein sos41_27270 [Alphaproteobacteria bacterium SO-S41]